MPTITPTPMPPNTLRLAVISEAVTGQTRECFDDQIAETVAGLFSEPDETIQAWLDDEDYDALGITIETISDDDMTPAQWEHVYAEPYRRDPHRTGDHRLLRMWDATVKLPPSGPKRGLSVEVAIGAEKVTIEPSTWLQLVKAVRAERARHAQDVALRALAAATARHADALRAVKKAESERDKRIRAARQAGVAVDEIARVAGISPQRYYQIASPA